MAKYLDMAGVDYLWKKVIAADAESLGKIKFKYDDTTTHGGSSKNLVLTVDKQEFVVDATPFIKDGMLEDVTVTTPNLEGGSIWYNGKEYKNDEVTGDVKFLKFLWNVADDQPQTGDKEHDTSTNGTNKVDYILLSDMAPVYEAGNGVAIEAGKVSANVDAVEGNYLKNDAAGLKVTEMGADVTKTKAAIPVVGGPLAKLLNDAGIKEIAPATDMEALLKKLFCQEKWPEKPTVTPGKLSSAFATPSFTLTNSSKTVEVGTKATVSAVTGYDPKATPTARKYSGFEYGYAMGPAKVAEVTPGNPNEVPVTDVALNAGEFTLTRTYNGFGKEATPVAVKNATSTLCNIPQDETLVVAEGTNTVTFKMEGPGHKGTVVESPVYYAASNLKLATEDHMVVLQGKQDLNVDIATAGSKSLSVTGARYMFWGGYDNVAEVDSARVRTLAIDHAGGTKASQADTLHIVGANIKQFIIALPAGRTLVSVTNDKAMNKDITGDFTNGKQTVQVEGLNKFAAAAYDVYVYNSKTTWVDVALTIIIK